MSQDYWENRYQTKDMRWEKGAPSPGLVDFLAAHPQLGRGKVCVPGCGTGHDVREWAKAGFAAYGFDIAPSAIRLGNEKSGAMAESLRRTEPSRGFYIEFQLADFLRDEPPFQFGWLFEHTFFCAINPAQRENYVRAVLRWLKPGGQYLAVNYLIPDTDGPPFGTTREELWRLFSPHFDLAEEWVPRSYPNRTGLELMMWWTRKK